MESHNHSHEHNENGHSHNHHDHAADDHQARALPSVCDLDNSENNNEETSPVMIKFRRAAVLCSVFLIVEIIGGYISGSLAILSDAAHLFSDLASIAVAMGASYVADLPKTDDYTFGLKRVESLAALLSMLSLALVSIYLTVQAIIRLFVPEAVNGRLMSIIALTGVLVNIALAWVLGDHHVHMPSDGHDHSHDHTHSSSAVNEKTPLKSASHDHHDHSHSHHENDNTVCESSSSSSSTSWIPFLPDNINLRATYIHVLGDLLQSVAVLIAGVVIWVQPAWTWVDPLCTLIFCVIVFMSTLGVVKSSLAVLLQQVPVNINYQDVFQRISQSPGVSDVHDLHIWSISHGIPTLSVHCTAEDTHDALESIYDICREFGIEKATVQVQSATTGACITCSDRICSHIEPSTVKAV